MGTIHGRSYSGATDPPEAADFAILATDTFHRSKVMVAARTAFDAITDRCRTELEFKCIRGTAHQAKPLFEAEVHLIRNQGFEDALIQIVEFSEQLRKRNVAFHVIGSGGSSVILFLLGISEVDPIRYGTLFQRLWITASGKPPVVMFTALSLSQVCWSEIRRPMCVSVHPMTALEAIPAALEARLTNESLTKPDASTFASLRRGDMEGLFQLESEPARQLLAQVQPKRIKALASVTALEQIS